METIRLKEGNELHFLSFGERNRGQGKTLIFVHGAGANGETWRRTAENLEHQHWILEYLTQQLPRATLRVIEECGHAPMVEHPERLAGFLEEFLT